MMVPSINFSSLKSEESFTVASSASPVMDRVPSIERLRRISAEVRLAVAMPGAVIVTGPSLAPTSVPSSSTGAGKSMWEKVPSTKFAQLTGLPAPYSIRAMKSALVNTPSRLRSTATQPAPPSESAIQKVS
jgi:hypothetical protein